MPRSDSIAIMEVSKGMDSADSARSADTRLQGDGGPEGSGFGRREEVWRAALKQTCAGPSNLIRPEVSVSAKRSIVIFFLLGASFAELDLTSSGLE